MSRVHLSHNLPATYLMMASLLAFSLVALTKLSKHLDKAQQLRQAVQELIAQGVVATISQK